jgi:hypothetical protein
MMDASEKYGNFKMVLEIFELIEEIKLKPNAAIMSYLLNGISNNSQSMNSVQKLFQKYKEVKSEVQYHSIVKLKLNDEL